jgi:hypothetical protein
MSKEKTWKYDCDLVFNNRPITKLTITDHYLKKHSKVINNQLIRELVNKLEDLDPEPKEDQNMRDVYVWERIPHQGKKYRLIFWFKDGTTNHLWIRNCHPQD